MESGADPTSGQRTAIRSAARSADAIVVLTCDARQGQLALVSELQRTAVPVIVASTGAPYDTGRLPEGLSVLATYSDRPIAMLALARVLSGEVEPFGRLPVSIPAVGTGLRYRIGWRAPS